MLEFLLGKWTLVAGAAVAVVGMLGTLFYSIKKAGRDEQKAKEAAAHAKHLDEIDRAGAAKPRGGVSDDPHNRDNRK